MENCSIQNSSPATGPDFDAMVKAIKSDHSFHHSNTQTLRYSGGLFAGRVNGAWWPSCAVESWTLRLFNAQRSTLNTQRSIQTVECWTLATAEPVEGGGGLDVGRSPRRSASSPRDESARPADRAEAGWTFALFRRVNGAWWPSRSSKPLSVRKSRGRFDSCPLRELIL